MKASDGPHAAIRPAIGGDDEQGHRRQSADGVAQEEEGTVAGPLQVVDHQKQGLAVAMAANKEPVTTKRR